ncbi:hypothetical protein KKF59_02320 [Patescibacteria group bacterium]|nr:hypothetical protein [Patescibacteria group bacterium]
MQVSIHEEILKQLLALNIPEGEIARVLDIDSSELDEYLKASQRIAGNSDILCREWYQRAFLALAEKSCAGKLRRNESSQAVDQTFIATLSSCVRKGEILAELRGAILTTRLIGKQKIPNLGLGWSRLFWRLFGHQETHHSINDAAEELLRSHLRSVARREVSPPANESEAVRMIVSGLVHRMNRWLILPWQPFIADRLEEAIRDLPVKQQLVAWKHFGLTGPKKTLAEIGREINETQWICARLMKCALRQLRSDPRFDPDAFSTDRLRQESLDTRQKDTELLEALRRCHSSDDAVVQDPPSSVWLWTDEGRKVLLAPLLQPVEQLQQLTARAKSAIDRLDALFIGDVIQLSCDRIRKLRNAGMHTVCSIREALQPIGLDIDMRLLEDQRRIYLNYRALYA